MLPRATSPISAAIVAVIVRTGRKIAARDAGSTAAFPVTIMTAMVSPMARPMPSMTAVRMPDRAAGTTTRQMVCHFVAPMARPASR